MEKQQNAFLGTEPIGKLMRKFAMPCVISLLVGALYNIVDQIFIANADYLGSYGNAANTVVFPLTVIALAIATMIGDGCCTFVSISMGARRSDDARRGVGSSVVALVAVSLILTAIYLAFMNPILDLFGARVNDETFRLSREYFFYIALGVPFYMFGQALNPIIRSDDSPKFAMATLLTGAILNCILDPIFIYVFHWGMMGAAVATVIGQVASAILALIYLFRMRAIRLNADSFKFRFRLMKKILPLGITSFLSQISIVLSMAAVLNMVKKYGAMDPVFSQTQYSQIPTAVIGIVMKFFQIVVAIAIGLAAGCIPIIGYNVGANEKGRVRELLLKLTVAEAITGLIATLICECFPNVLIGIFGAAGESVHYTNFAVRAFRIYLCMMIPACVNKAAFIYLQALGKAAAATMLSMVREVVFGVGFALLLPQFFGLDGVLYSMPVSDVLTFAVSAVVIARTCRILRAA